MSTVARRFSRAAQTYERGAGLHRHVAARLLEMFPEPDQIGAGSILEVGCGTGVLTNLVRQRYPAASLCVMDVAGGMVDSVRERWGADPAMRYVVSDVRDFKADRPFDLIASSSALHWATPLETTMVALQGLLAPGGALCAALMIDGTLGELHAVRRQNAPHKIPPGRLTPGYEVLSALRGAGFDVIAHEEETIQARYHSADDFLRTIHAQGLTAGAVSRAALPLSRTELNQLRQGYDAAYRDPAGGVYASFEVLYFKSSAVQYPVR